MKKCWELKGCPASHYIGCEAYKREADCWDIKKGCLCLVAESCEKCLLFLKHLSDAEL